MNTLKVVLVVATLLSLSDLPLAAAAPTRPGAGTAARPNIVLMVADDLGYNDVGCYGASLVKTPRIDALARQGVRFTDAHSMCAICIPSRYSILSGTYYFHAKFKGRYPLMFHAGQVTLPSLLKSAGYRTAALGKWHSGFGRESEPDYNQELKPGPLEIGFDTLVIFTSDNGGRYENTAMKAGHRTNGELLGQKTDAWEGGHRVPCIARWPNRIPAGTVRKEFFVQVDLMATLAEAAGIPLPQGASPDGSSELAAFLQPTVAPAKRTEALLHGSKGIVLRQGDWIYLPKQGSLGYSAPEPERPFGLPYAKMGFTNSDIDEHGQIKPGAPREQLYNLATDLQQRKNLAVERPERVSAMRARFLELSGPPAGERAERRAQGKKSNQGTQPRQESP